MAIEIRTATQADLDWLLIQLDDFAKFYKTKKDLFGDKVYARDYLSKLIDIHLFLIAEEGDTRMGFIAGLVVGHPFNPQISILQELFWWVPEEYRGTRAGLKLFNAFNEFGEEKCDWVSFTLENHSPVSDNFLTKRGFVEKETTYLRESKWQQ